VEKTVTITTKKLCTSLLITAALGASMNMAWAAESLEDRIKTLENKLAEKSEIESDNAMSAKLYATVRPSLTYFNVKDDNRVEVTDFLSFAGLYSEAELGGGWTAMAHGEWGFDIAGDAEFGKARRASVGLSYDGYGKIAFGKDRAIDYLLHATHVDIFNHRASPFAYDQIGKDAFFTDNQITYANTWDTITFMAGFKFAKGDGVDYAEQSIAGLGYDKNGLHFAVSFKSTDTGAVDNTDTVAISYAQQITDDFYLAAMYQDEEEIGTLDVSVGYQLTNKYKVKAGYYDFDDGISTKASESNNGFNLTLERQFTPKFRTHIEVLTKSYDNFEDEVAFAIGLKYDIAVNWKS
jgi:predicted porin|tara:strand:+ start:522 stop:1574 length:1053 start_codon:yes stop_codon:yes gene_type:complete